MLTLNLRLNKIDDLLYAYKRNNFKRSIPINVDIKGMNSLRFIHNAVFQ